MVLLSKIDADSPVVTVIIDTGCSTSLSPCREDFIEFEATEGTISTVSGSAPILGHGLVRWILMTEGAEPVHVVTRANYCPSATQRLLSPQDYCLYHGLDTTVAQYGGTATYVWLNAMDAQGKMHRFHCPINERAKLPIAWAKVIKDCLCTACTACTEHGYITVAEETNQNLTRPMKELLLWHWRLGHRSMSLVQSLFRRPSKLPSEESPSSIPEPSPMQCIDVRHSGALTCDPPKCAACCLAKQRRRSADTQTTADTRTHVTTTDHLAPGQCISVDQYEYSVLGRRTSSRGGGTPSSKFVGGTIFVDHMSRFIHAEHQLSLRTRDTILGKRNFERSIRTMGVRAQAYHGDNGVFNSTEFQQELELSGQTMTFSGVGAHHQNGIAERAIQIVVEIARSMMQHASLHWPGEFDEELWPLALDYAVWLWNNTPIQGCGLSPAELISGTRTDHSHLQRARVWGSPVYVLDPRLQDGKKVPKWKPRSRRGQFLGFSPLHSSTVAQVRNLKTNAISPQFHLVFDELFQTVANEGANDQDPKWVHLFRNQRDVYLEEEDLRGPFDLEFMEDFLTEEEVEYRARQRNHDAVEEVESIAEDDERPTSTPVTEAREEAATEEFPVEAENTEDPTSETEEEDLENRGNEGATSDDPTVVHSNRSPLAPRRSQRSTRGVAAPRFAEDQRFHFSKGVTLSDDGWLVPSRNPNARMGTILQPMDPDDVRIQRINWSAKSIHPVQESAYFHRFQALNTDPYTKEVEAVHPFAYAAKASDADSPTFREIMRMPPEQQEAWAKAMEAEFDALLHKGTFEWIDRSKVPKGKQIVLCTWVFKIKRAVDMTIRKLKARLCVRGDRQDLRDDQGNEPNCYAPVVQWATIRLIFNLMIAHGLKSTQIDFRNAFVQSSLPEPIYMEPPAGLDDPSRKNQVLKVTRSLYGDRRAPQLWYNHLRKGLEGQGFRISPNDPCLFLRNDCLFIVHVDDGIFVAKDSKVIETCISKLEKDGYDLDPERGDLAGFLGIKIEEERTPKGETTGNLILTQSALIERILKALRLSESKKTRDRPAIELLSAGADLPPHRLEWNYRSVEGMMLYLAQNTRPDISMAVHQAARFANDPRENHSKALMDIGRYLLGTRDKGMILNPSRERISLDMFCDADFAGLFKVENRQDPSSAKSRTGFIITLGGAPVLWASKLQTEIATSTCEAEYIALSTGMRSLLPARNILEEVITTLQLSSDPLTQISTVWEDNEAALILATTDPPKISSRTKHFNVKYHWFRSHLEKGKVECKKIDTSEQWADILTKPLDTVKFRTLRKKIMGW